MAPGNGRMSVASWSLRLVNANQKGMAAVQRIVLDAEARQVAAELVRRGIDAHAWVHVLVEVAEAGDPPMAVLAQAGQALDLLADAPELYADVDLVGHAG
jgi:hypothetical protein